MMLTPRTYRWPRLLKLDSFVLFVSFFVCSNNLVSRGRVPVVFYLNMSKKGKKQDVNDDSFESERSPPFYSQ